jgi:hypothetical protein
VNLNQFGNYGRVALLLVILLSIIIRVGLIGVMVKHGFNDQEEGIIARSILNGQGYSYAGTPTAHKPPLYTFILTLCFLPFPSEWTPINYNNAILYHAHLVDQILKVFVAAATVLVLYRLGKIVFSPLTGLLGAFLYAANPLLAVQILFPGHMPYDMLFFTATLLLFMQVFQDAAPKTVLIYSVVCAITVLENPVILAFILPAQAWLLFRGKYRYSRRWLQSLVLPIVFIVIFITPWTYRNYRVFNRFVPFTSNFSLELWYGNNNLATGGFYQGSMPVVSYSIDNKPLNEVQRNQELGREAIEFILKHPLTALKLRISSAYYFWFGSWQFTGFPIIFTRVWYALNFLTIITAFIGIILAASKSFERNVPLLIMITGLFIPYILTHSGDDRYRAGIMPLLMLYIVFLLVRPNIQAEAGSKKFV